MSDFLQKYLSNDLKISAAVIQLKNEKEIAELKEIIRLLKIPVELVSTGKYCYDYIERASYKALLKVEKIERRKAREEG